MIISISPRSHINDLSLLFQSSQCFRVSNASSAIARNGVVAISLDNLISSTRDGRDWKAVEIVEFAQPHQRHVYKTPRTLDEELADSHIYHITSSFHINLPLVPQDACAPHCDSYPFPMLSSSLLAMFSCK